MKCVYFSDVPWAFFMCGEGWQGSERVSTFLMCGGGVAGFRKRVSWEVKPESWEEMLDSRMVPGNSCCQHKRHSHLLSCDDAAATCTNKHRKWSPFNSHSREIPY